MTKPHAKPHAKTTKDSLFNGMALICSELCFDKTENDRFQSNSGGVFLTQRVIEKFTMANQII